jgi:hypothetical protein
VTANTVSSLTLIATWNDGIGRREWVTGQSAHTDRRMKIIGHADQQGHQITNFKSDQISSFPWSADGKKIEVHGASNRSPTWFSCKRRSRKISFGPLERRRSRPDPDKIEVAEQAFLDVRNDQQAPCNCDHVLGQRHGEVWHMRPHHQSMASFVTRECPYKSAANPDDGRNQ